MKKDPSYAEAIANSLVLQVIIGKDPQELIEYVHPSIKYLFFPFLDLWRLTMTFHFPRRTLKKTAPQHAFLTDLQEKSDLFDAAAAKFSAKVSA